LVPVATLGLAAIEIFRDELTNFDRKYSSRIAQDEFGILNRLLTSSDTETIKRYDRPVRQYDTAQWPAAL